MQQHVKNIQKQMMVAQSENEELEEYDRRLCIRVGRTMFYQNRNKLKSNTKVKLDLTSKRYVIFMRALESVKKVRIVDYVMVNINCHLKVVFKNGRSKFFRKGFIKY